jgi:hypothetical protein
MTRKARCDLIAEGLEALVALVQRGNQPGSMLDVGLSEQCYTLNGKVWDKPVPLYRRTVESLDDLLGVAADVHVEKNERSSCCTDMAFWVSNAGVKLLTNENDSRQWVLFPLTYSKPWQLLKKFAANIELLEQKVLVRTLVLIFDADPAVVVPWRKLNFTNGSTVSRETYHDKDRLGREIQSQASGMGDLPETIALSVPIFREMGERDPVTVVSKVEIDAAAGRIAMVPNELQLAAAEEFHLVEIKRRIAEELSNVPVYLGSVG